MNVSLLLILGMYSNICVLLQSRIAFFPLTKQSSSCPLYKQTGWNDQYGYQTHPAVACTFKFGPERVKKRGLKAHERRLLLQSTLQMSGSWEGQADL